MQEGRELSVTFPKGFLSAGIKCGIKKSGRSDLALIYSIVPAVAAGMFTSNEAKAAPVKVCLKRIRKRRAQAVIVNSGNANCATGKQGVGDAWEMARIAAKELELSEELVLVSSTGLIGKRLPMEKIRVGIPLVVKSLRKSWRNAAKAIMTTDKRIKQARASVKIGGKTVKIGAICKGAGMICPKMATMLCFITTDAAVEQKALRQALKQAVNSSFNCISVDGDMSTNDSVIILANGRAKNKEIPFGSREYNVFAEALKNVCVSLAKKIILDGEGATKFIEINVQGAASNGEAKKVALTLANSLLFKTAVYGQAVRCGPIMGAVGRAPARMKENVLDVWIGRVKFIRNGVGPFEKEKAEALMKEKEIVLTIDLKIGKGRARVWTCDLTHGYVRENAAYWT